MPIKNICKNCGGELTYDPSCEELKCNNCSSIVDIPEQYTILKKKTLNEKSNIKTSKTKFSQFHCSTCGRNHISATDKELVTCPSCGDNNLTKILNVEYIPDGIIPFKLNKENALQCFKNWIKKSRFTPKKLKETKNCNFSNLYIPAYLYDFYCESYYSGIGVNETTSYRYNSTTKQSIPIHHTYREPFSGSREDEYNNFIDSANSNIPTTILKKIDNFNYKDIYIYRPEFLYGFLSYDVNVPLEISVKNTKNFILNDISFKAQNSHFYNRVENFVCETNFIKSEFSYLYLPIYSCNYSFKNKIYNFYINGVTGKTYGKTPKSKGKIASLILLILGAIGVFSYLIIKYLI